MKRAIQFAIKITWESSKFLFCSIILLQTTIALSSLFNIFIYKEIIDSATSKISLLGLTVIQLVMLRFGYEIIRRIMISLSSYLWGNLYIKHINYVTNLFVDKIASLDLTSFENATSVRLIRTTLTRLQYQIMGYSKKILQVISSLIEISLSLFIFLTASPLGGILILISNLIPILVKRKLSPSTYLVYYADTETQAKFDSVFSTITDKDTLPEIKSFQAFNYFRKRLNEIYTLFSTKQLNIEKRNHLILTPIDLLPVLATFGYLFYLSQNLMSGTISAGVYIFLFANIFIFSSALERISQDISGLDTDSHFILDIISMFDLKPSIIFPKISETTKSELSEKTINPTITFENVSFSYPGSDAKVLKNINLTIPYGQNLALIGENGAGKTTLVKLLLRMYDPTEGKILINGINIKDIPEEFFFSLYSNLFQTFGKFNLSIKENLELAAGKNLSEEEVVRILKFSNAWEFIENTKGKLNQQLGTHYEDGTDLSGGQWQRLAIARAYAKSAPILILDEPTSAVDAKSEAEIFDRLNKEMKTNTVIFISHRFSTIKDAERIVVLDNGEILEEGNHTKLMKNKGKYFNLYTIQAERYKR